MSRARTHARPPRYGAHPRRPVPDCVCGPRCTTKTKKNSSSSSRAAVIRRYRLMAAEVVPTAAPHTVMQIGLQSMQLDTLYAAYSGRMQQISISKSSVSDYTVVSRDKKAEFISKRRDEAMQYRQSVSLSVSRWWLTFTPVSDCARPQAPLSW